jgi:hypothetical protein
LSEIAENKSPEVTAGDIISGHVTESTQNLISNLCGRGRKRFTKTHLNTSKSLLKSQSNKKGHFLLTYNSRCSVMSGATVSISSELDVFARKPIQTAVVETIETVYKPIAPWNKAI